MNRTIPLLAVSVILMVLFSGCPSQQPPKELFKELSEKAGTLPDGKYSYTFTWEVNESVAASMGMQIPTTDYDIEIYSLNGNKKSVLKMETLGINVDTSYFEIGGESTSCIKSDMDLGLGNSGTVCQKYDEGASAPFLSALLFTLEPDDLEKVDISLLGEKTYAGRSCQEFFSSIGEDIFGEIKNTFGPQTSSISANYNTCLDKEHGFALYSETSLFSNVDGTKQEIVKATLQLDSYDPNAVSPSDFEIPSDASWLPPMK